MKRTALYNEHLQLNGRMVEFGGWEMPVQYTGLADEHDTCRNYVGLFDVSHMGEVTVKGPGAGAYLNYLLTNNILKMAVNQAQYNVMCYEDGGCVDDLIVHKFDEDDYFICVNASNTDKDFDWIKTHAPKGVEVQNVSAQWSQIAIQGRDAVKIVSEISGYDVSDIKYYWFKRSKVLGDDAIIARTGYTGEDGFELYVPWNSGPKVWRAALESGKRYQIKACGLGARDTLRTEMKYPLYGHEIDQKLNPIEAGLGWVVKFDKGDFIGREPLLKIKNNPSKALIGLKTAGRGIPRQGYLIEKDGKNIGFVTSGTHSPSLKHGIAIAYVDKQHSNMGNTVDVCIRDQKVAHNIVATPFYKRPY